MPNLDTARLAALERRVVALEDKLGGATAPPPAEIPDLVGAIKNMEGLVDGAVMFGGAVATGGGTFNYQWIRPTHWVTDDEWGEQIDRLAALAHPVRGEILRHALSCPVSAAELVSDGVVSSTGTAYHHLHALQAAGWLTKESGSYAVPPARVVPLMTIITAAEAH